MRGLAKRRWMAGSAAIGLATALAGPPAGAAPPDTACAAEVAAQRERWRAAGEPILQPPAGPGDVLRHWPTDALGVWLVERVAPDETSLTRVTADRLSRVRWSAGCAAGHDERDRPAAIAPAFADRDLEALLRRQPRGVLYVWSPHMPLSVDGWRPLQQAASARGLAVEPLLDPQADRAFAAASLTGGGMPATALRVVDSVELQFRELALHAPSIAVFDRGRLTGAGLRGYRTADEYREFFDRVLPK